MKTISHYETLFYYDGPQVFEARDSLGDCYIAMMVSQKDGIDQYLVAAVSTERLYQFRAGLLDLKLLLTEERSDAWYLATAHHGLDQPLLLNEQLTPLNESELLPEPGFVLHDRPAEVELLDEPLLERFTFV